MIEHIITIKVTEDLETFNLEISTPETLRTIETVGILDLAKKQYIESKHATHATIYQEPHSLNHEGSDRWTGGDRKDEA